MVDDTASELTPLARASVTRDVTARLFDYLMDGSLTPGSRLPSERRMAEALQVGRSAVRETLAAFEVLGIVESRPGSGTYLRSQTSDLLPLVINWGLTLGRPRLLDLVEARNELEVSTARLAAERRDEEGVKRMRVQLDRMARTVDSDREDFVAADVAFHLEMGRIADNSVLGDLLYSVRSLLHVWMGRATKAQESNQPTLREHRQIFRAIEAGDGAAAEKAMRTHMRAAGRRLQQLLDRG